MGLHIQIIGIILMLIAIVHLAFPKQFHWKTELPKLSLVNRQIMQVHTFFIALLLVLMGFLCFFYHQLIVSTELGKVLSLGLFIFWAIRLFFQLFVYSPKLWRGKKFETTVHIIFIVLWSYISVVFLINYLL